MEFKSGEIYTSTDNDNIYIWKCDVDGAVSASRRLYFKEWGISQGDYQNYTVGFHGWTIHREPTYEEKSWLEACIQAGCFVSKPESGINYEIY